MYRKDFGFCLRDYFKLTGKPLLIPRYSLGVWWYKNIEYNTDSINKLIDDQISLNDIVILYRTNAQSRVFEDGLLKANIPYKIIGGLNFYSRMEIKNLLAYLRLIYNSNDIIFLK